MKIIVAGSEDQKTELGAEQVSLEQLLWVEDASSFSQFADADVFIDLNFNTEPQRLELLNKLLPKLVIINYVSGDLTEVNDRFIRINGWNTFLKGDLLEAASINADRGKVEQLFGLLQKKIEWTSDVPGFITGRVISMIINEAYFALEEEVSTKEQIDLAMKLGTNYPYGPFEWAEKIGLKNISDLLKRLSETEPRYRPSALLLQEAQL